MTLEEYALGHADSDDSFGKWMEFKTKDLCSIRGGAAGKHVIFKRKDREGWRFPKEFTD
jgi:5-methylcytosine-specific restriction enzyme B